MVMVSAILYGNKQMLGWVGIHTIHLNQQSYPSASFEESIFFTLPVKLYPDQIQSEIPSVIVSRDSEFPQLGSSNLNPAAETSCCVI
jgi:hypothetical protein